MAVGLVIVGWLLNTPEGLLGKADAIGYAVCHRIDLRSFYLGERQLPLCARCTGMYLGAVLGLLYQWRIAPRRESTPPPIALVVMAIFVGAFIVDGLNSFLSLIRDAPGLYPPNNPIRLFTGTGMGLVLALALYPAFNSSVWGDSIQQPAIKGIRSLAALLILAIGLDLLVLLENPLIMYPLALVSAGGVVLLLTMVYTMVWVMILKSERRYNQVNGLVFPLLGGLAFAMIQIASLDVVRYFLTGTWDGFHLG